MRLLGPQPQQLRKLAAPRVATIANNNNSNSKGPKRNRRSLVPNAPGVNDPRATRFQGTSQIATKTMVVATTMKK